MEAEILKYLYDIKDATAAILKFVQDKPMTIIEKTICSRVVSKENSKLLVKL